MVSNRVHKLRSCLFYAVQGAFERFSNGTYEIDSAVSAEKSIHFLHLSILSAQQNDTRWTSVAGVLFPHHFLNTIVQINQIKFQLYQYATFPSKSFHRSMRDNGNKGDWSQSFSFPFKFSIVTKAHRSLEVMALISSATLAEKSHRKVKQRSVNFFLSNKDPGHLCCLTLKIPYQVLQGRVLVKSPCAIRFCCDIR